MIGIALFAVASLACGLSNSIGVLIASRAVQGLGAAIISPATLSIITTTFEEGSERNKALGIWGAMGGSGAAAGVLFGGILTKYAGWEWIFFVNVPVGVAVLAADTPARPREPHRRAARLRLPRRGDDHGEPRAARLRDLEGARRRLGQRAHDRLPHRRGRAARRLHRDRDSGRTAPMVPFRIFRLRTVTGANVAGFLLGAVVFSNFFLLTLYVQQVLALLGAEDRADVPRHRGDGDPRRRRCRRRS